jgi:type VI secretion system protein ImpK
MTPKFANAVDPIFLQILDLLARIQRQDKASAQEERLRVGALFDQAAAVLGAGAEWELAKYALASWIDEVLLDAPWDGADWWSNNVLEVALFNTRLCNERFYLRALEASSLAQRDALEVFYVCVVLGFRGLYRDPHLAAMMTQMHGLPPDLEGWSKQTALAIRLGQGRPQLAGPRRELLGAPPLRNRPLAVWSWLLAALLSAGAAVAYSILFLGT